MPEMAGEFTVRGLLLTLGFMGVLTALLCLALTLAARHFPPRNVWLGSGMIFGGLCVVAFGRLYLWTLGVQGLDPAYVVLFLAALLGMPSAAAVWVAVRRAGRPERRSVVFDAFLVTATFVLVIPVGAVVAAIPDILVLLG